jgi:hypothetical protein
MVFVDRQEDELRKTCDWLRAWATAAIAKFGRGENLTTDVLLKICNVLNCGIANIYYGN